MRWWSKNGHLGWASCPLTQNGYLRIISQQAYPRPVPLPDAIAILRRQIAEGGHEFWPDDLSIVNVQKIDHTRLLGPQQITDIYLLALAVAHGGRLVTLDSSLSIVAVKGARSEHLVSL